MKAIVKKLLATAAGVLGLSCLCAGACTTKGGGKKPAEIADDYGYMRPTDAWITQCVILSGQNYETYKNNLFGTAGASGMLNPALSDLDGEGIMPDEQSYLVCMLYGEGLDINGCAFDTRFDVTYADGADYFTGTSCPVEFGNAIYNSEKIKLSLSHNDGSGYGLSVSPASAEAEKLQTSITLPFTPKAQSGVLCVDMRVDAPTLSTSEKSFVDGVHTARIGGFTNGFSAVADDVKIRFTNDADFPDGDFKSVAEFNSGETVYAVADFNLGALSDNGGGGKLTAQITVPEADIAEVTLIEATTGNTETKVENGYSRVSAEFSVPDLTSKKKRARVVLRIKTAYDGFSDIGLCFSCKGADLGCKPYYSARLKWGDPVFRYNYGDLKKGAYPQITGFWDKSQKEVALPDTYAGKSVSTVQEGAFSGTAVKKLTLGKNTQSVIGSLKDCYALEEITVPDGNKSLFTKDGVLYDTQRGDYSMFVPYTIDGAVTVADGVKEIGNEFKGKGVTEITLPDSVRKIADKAFENCKNLKKAKLGDGVTHIGSHAFYYCESLESISLGKNVTSIGSSAFWGTAYRKNERNWSNGALYLGDCLIEVNYGNGNSYKGSLSVRKGTRVIAESAVSGDVTGVTIPDSVISIGRGAFTSTAYYRTESNWTDGALYIGKFLVDSKEIRKDIYQIKKGTTVIADGALIPNGNEQFWVNTLIVPDSVKIIGSKIISSLNNVVLGSGATAFGEDCFGYGRPNTVYYNGSQKQWEALNIDRNKNSGLYGAKKYYYSSKKPSASGDYWRYVDGVPTPW